MAGKALMGLGPRLTALTGVILLAGCEQPPFPGLENGPVVLRCSGKVVTTSPDEDTKSRTEERFYKVTGGEGATLELYESGQFWSNLAFEEEMTFNQSGLRAVINNTRDDAAGYRSVNRTITMSSEGVMDVFRRNLPDVEDEATFNGSCEAIPDPAS